MADAGVRFAGRITDWNDDKGYGFVMPSGGGDRAFVHINDFQRGSRRPVDGDRHKTVKQPFQFIFWFTVIGNLVAAAWLLDGGGMPWMQDVLWWRTSRAGVGPGI